MTDPEPRRTIWFHRAFKGITGGEVKHSHYFDHVRQMRGFAPRVAFTGGPLNEALAKERRRLWPVGNINGGAGWTPSAGDVLFVAGTDWRYLSAMSLDGTNHPRINLVQAVRHADPDTELWSYLPRRAIRICVSAEVADALAATGRPRGPIIAIPNSTDLPPWDWGDQTPHSAWAARPRRIAIVGYKRPELAMAVSECLARRSIAHEAVMGFRHRGAFLGMLAETQVAVCLPNPTEGFYLPALEAMASGCVVVTLDAVGNRSFCHDGKNCIVARPDGESLAKAVAHTLRLSDAARDGLLAGAAETVAAHALQVERSRFHALLGDVDRLWAEAQRFVVAIAAAGSDHKIAADASAACPTSGAPYRPRLAFMIVGAQKSGTTALAQFLAAHPEIRMSPKKEVHLFDAQEYSRDWTPADIDARYRPYFAHCNFTGRAGKPILGEATPVYMFIPDIPAELRRYNPDLRLIVLLRDPVERAISHYYMEKGRGWECRPFWQALMLEPFRLLRDRDPRDPESAHRVQSYRARGLYSRQLRNLYLAFDPGRVLIVRSCDLLRGHDAELRRVFEFLGVCPDVRVPREIVFKGEPGRRKHRLASWLLRLSYMAEFARLRRFPDSRDESRHERGGLPATDSKTEALAAPFLTPRRVVLPSSPAGISQLNPLDGHRSTKTPDLPPDRMSGRRRRVS